MHSTAPAYRPEIDGLRALAVVPVALFHARVPGFAGGFVGVDVFFVISGYLITAILLREAGRSGALGHFYERRARRIVPALLPVLAFTLAAALWVFTPDDFRRFAQALGATALFVSNLLFALRSDYFGTAEGFTPLVHSWSLAVEEQFYLFFPVLLLALVRRRLKILPVILLILAASFVLAVAMAGSAPRFAFNLLPTRAWELMAGAACALLPPPAKYRWWAGLTGIVFIAAGMAFIRADTPAPGPMFALPVAGAALVVRYATGSTPAARALGWRPFVLIGLVSYGFYLWHQAILAFVFYTHFAPPPWWLAAAALILSLALAAASYRWVEKPVRAGRAFRSRRTLAAVCAGGLVAMAAIGLAGHFEVAKPRSAREARLWGAVVLHPTTNLVPEARDIPYLLYGDSHAEQYRSALAERLGRGAVLTTSGCMSLPAATNQQPGSPDRAVCKSQYGQALALSHAREVPVVIWAQRWERLLFRNDTGAREGETSGDGARFFRAQLDDFLAAFPAGTRIVLVGNSPTAWASGPQMDGGLLRCRAFLDVKCPTSFPAAKAEGRAANRILMSFARQHPRVTYVDAAGPLCPQGRCRILADGRLYYNDGSHMTLFAAQIVAREIASAMGSSREAGNTGADAFVRR
ncbi:acyltransferase [Tsuneonella deserti]|uniref:Acyltransferase n=1 Tax=Tsuneonella deserti TaxID=2035528 RepID=A0ABQ1SCM6_9SPHN|nr:acyltransferase family protein [Tsuneonella deserti]GGE04960.1 acyltransferase [Tsuneonella deserti]